MTTALDKATLLMTLTRQLTQVLDAETAMLRRVSLGQLAELQTEKQALTDVYVEELHELRRRPEILGSLAPGNRVELEMATREFQTAVARNAVALNAARTVVERVLRMIADSLKANPGYQPGPGRPPSAEILPFALDRHC